MEPDPSLAAIYRRIDPKSGKVLTQPLRQLSLDRQAQAGQRLCDEAILKSRERRAKLRAHYRQQLPTFRPATNPPRRMAHQPKPTQHASILSDLSDAGTDNSPTAVVARHHPMDQPDVTVDDLPSPQKAVPVKPWAPYTAPKEVYVDLTAYDSHQDLHLWGYWQRQRQRQRSGSRKARGPCLNSPPPVQKKVRPRQLRTTHVNASLEELPGTSPGPRPRTGMPLGPQPAPAPRGPRPQSGPRRRGPPSPLSPERYASSSSFTHSGIDRLLDLDGDGQSSLRSRSRSCSRGNSDAALSSHRPLSDGPESAAENEAGSGPDSDAGGSGSPPAPSPPLSGSGGGGGKREAEAGDAEDGQAGDSPSDSGSTATDSDDTDEEEEDED